MRVLYHTTSLTPDAPSGSLFASPCPPRAFAEPDMQPSARGRYCRLSTTSCSNKVCSQSGRLVMQEGWGGGTCGSSLAT